MGLPWRDVAEHPLFGHLYHLWTPRSRQGSLWPRFANWGQPSFVCPLAQVRQTISAPRPPPTARRPRWPVWRQRANGLLTWSLAASLGALAVTARVFACHCDPAYPACLPFSPHLRFTLFNLSFTSFTLATLYPLTNRTSLAKSPCLTACGSYIHSFLTSTDSHLDPSITHLHSTPRDCSSPAPPTTSLQLDTARPLIPNA